MPQSKVLRGRVGNRPRPHAIKRAEVLCSAASVAMVGPTVRLKIRPIAPSELGALGRLLVADIAHRPPGVTGDPAGEAVADLGGPGGDVAAEPRAGSSAGPGRGRFVGGLTRRPASRTRRRATRVAPAWKGWRVLRIEARFRTSAGGRSGPDWTSRTPESRP